MQNAHLAHFAWMAIAIALEVSANVLIKYSDRFRRRLIGFAGIASILLSFTALAQAVKGIDLSVAYALWGGTGIALTAIAGLLLFRQSLSTTGWAGIALIVGGMSLLRLA
ncbi:multidrug/spermidine efflux SMR transporter subunit MdtI [Brucella pseudogrignonensis]|uniref:multidrug/spermidine efflux SMR transporter subunit MdtI n=1 Tax=Brucella pseudogrignonensis TaxID=419475 RepID=UPI003D96D5F1